MAPPIDRQSHRSQPSSTQYPAPAGNNSKATSYASPSPSCEADDERSISDLASMENDGSRRPRHPSYEGEDTRLTSTKELAGWYSYGWAAEVFVVCGIGSFIPVTLEQLAREKGVLLWDGVSPCRASFDNSLPSVNGTLPATHLFARSPGVDDGQCVVYLLGMEINTASFAMYTFSLSVLVQALLVITLSAVADHGKYRKSLLLGLAVIGATATMMFLFVSPNIYVLGALLAVVSNTSFGASFVLLNSFLPLLVRFHPSVQYTSPRSTPDNLSISTPEHTSGASAVELESSSVLNNVDSRVTLLRNSDPMRLPNKKPLPASPELQLSTQISSNGLGIGYIAAVIVQTISIVILILTGSSSTFSLQLVLFFIGAWWLVFTIPAALWLRPRPGPPLPSSGSGRKERSWFGYFLYAWTSLGRTVMRARQLKDVVLFLVAWFLLSDGIATVSGTAILFAKTQLEMKPAALALISLIATTCGIVGAFTWSRISTWLGLRPSQTILACICIFEIIPLYGLLGYLPFIQRMGVFGLQKPWEMFVLGAVFGFVLGGLSSYCRSLFGELIPPGSEAAFYALYAITDKGSSIFGPLVVGMITDRFGSIRPAFWFLAVLVGLPAPFMFYVDVDRGKIDGAKLAKELAGGPSNDGAVEESIGLLRDE
ncbi:MAG: Autophagy protein 22 [Trizodia sp. TS-e1964]|nr:MAG: Autophagy protein 22 [Trizodia sp. TS-e1964]